MDIISTVSSWMQGLSFVDIFNLSVLAAFSVCYFYQLVYVVVSLVKAPKALVARRDHRYAVLISARNESSVIADLLRSLQQQDYPTDLVDVYVIADNCDDDTAEIARECGATVFKRFNKKKIGKGYALNWGLHRIWEQFDDECETGAGTVGDETRWSSSAQTLCKRSWKRGAEKCPYDAYFVFDADNVLSRTYISEMNKTFDAGAKASTSYRNSKNFSTNWISAGYGIWFLREARFLSQSRLLLNTSCAISGTGFFIAHELLKDANGWKWHLLTEDIEFSAYQICRGTRISYSPEAVLYDEQPEDFRTSWNQRYRWAKGFYQVFAHYAGGLVKGIFTNRRGRKWACYDMLMTIAPGMLLTIITVLFNLIIVIMCLAGVMSIGNALASSATSIVFCLANYCVFMGLLGAITVFVEWDSIRAPRWKKIAYCATFPFFMLTYIPIALAALFGKAKWTPIKHNVSVDVEQFASVREQKKTEAGN